MTGIYARGTRSCTGCDYAKNNSKIERCFNLHEARWEFYRSCAWCGCCYPATVEEWNAENPEQQHTMEVQSASVQD